MGNRWPGTDTARWSENADVLLDNALLVLLWVAAWNIVEAIRVYIHSDHERLDGKNAWREIAANLSLLAVACVLTLCLASSSSAGH